MTKCLSITKARISRLDHSYKKSIPLDLEFHSKIWILKFQLRSCSTRYFTSFSHQMDSIIIIIIERIQWS